MARSGQADVDAAVAAAVAAQAAWALTPAVQRGAVLHRICNALEAHQQELAAIVARETGKSQKDALGETGGAIEMGFFVAGEGRGSTAGRRRAAVPNKYAMIVRQPLGVAGLIIAANTPIANVAWKVFPALICGNAAMLKAAEDTPLHGLGVRRARARGRAADGVLNVVHGLRREGRRAAGRASRRRRGELHRLDRGRPLDRARPRAGAWRRSGSSSAARTRSSSATTPTSTNAVTWALCSAFSNAGQRCAAGSRIIVFDAVYDAVRDDAGRRPPSKLKVGPDDGDDFGPVINERQIDQHARRRRHGRRRAARRS